ncbi:MAG: S46 family peptidase [Planctomycetes bacterium]|nr:S46 family peptidase [Planctomycetota bacterium]
MFSDEQSRGVAVDIRALLETLRKLYDAKSLADELGR